jgi:hypothetical protein
MQRARKTGRAVLHKSRQQSEATARPPGCCREATSEGALGFFQEGFGVFFEICLGLFSVWAQSSLLTSICHIVVLHCLQSTADGRGFFHMQNCGSPTGCVVLCVART